MIQPCVTISLVPEAKGGPFVFWDDLAAGCRTAKEIGFPVVELFCSGPTAVSSEELQAILDENDLTLGAVGTGAGAVIQGLTLTSPDGTIRQKAKEFIRQMIDFGGPFKAPAIIGSMQGRHGGEVSPEQARVWLSEALEELGEHATQYGIPLIYEPLNRYETNLVTTMQAGVELLESLSTSNVKLLADLFHMNIEEANVADGLRAGGAHIGHLHFVDSNRQAAGWGHTDFEPIAKALQEIGYEGLASAEAFPIPDPEATAKQTLTAFNRYLASN